MADDINARIDTWLSACPDPATDPLPGMAEAGLNDPAPDYAAIAQTKAALVERTGLIGVSGVWSGPQLVNRWFIDRFGTAEQKALWLGQRAAVAISEPKVGAHPKLLQTRAEETTDGFRITGEKAWVSNGPSAAVIIVVAITAEENGRKRYSAFLVPRDTPGLVLRDMPGFHALRPSRHCALVLEGCAVPRSALLGPPGVAYERMAMPFRDVEDAVGTFGTLGAMRFLLRRLAMGGDASEPRAQSLGALAALTAVFEDSARAVVARLDAGRLDGADATLVGLRVLTADFVARVRAHVDAHGPAEDEPAATMLSDLDATQSVARGPRMARQTRLGTALIDRAGQDTP